MTAITTYGRHFMSTKQSFSAPVKKLCTCVRAYPEKNALLLVLALEVDECRSFLRSSEIKKDSTFSVFI